MTILDTHPSYIEIRNRYGVVDPHVILYRARDRRESMLLFVQTLRLQPDYDRTRETEAIAHLSVFRRDCTFAKMMTLKYDQRETVSWWAD